VKHKTEYVVLTAAAAMPNSCWGRYGRVALLEVRCDDEGRPILPGLISDRPHCVVRIVRTWERLNKGTTDRCAFAVALQEAEDLACELNDKRRA